MDTTISPKHMFIRDTFLVALVLWVISTVTEEMVPGFFSDIINVDLIDGFFLVCVGLLMFTQPPAQIMRASSRTEKVLQISIIVSTFLLVFARTRVISNSIGVILACLAAALVAIFSSLIHSDDDSPDRLN